MKFEQNDLMFAKYACVHFFLLPFRSGMSEGPGYCIMQWFHSRFLNNMDAINYWLMGNNIRNILCMHFQLASCLLLLRDRIVNNIWVIYFNASSVYWPVGICRYYGIERFYYETISASKIIHSYVVIQPPQPS